MHFAYLLSLERTIRNHQKTVNHPNDFSLGTSLLPVSQPGKLQDRATVLVANSFATKWVTIVVADSLIFSMMSQ